MPVLEFATIPIWLQELAYVYLIGGILLSSQYMADKKGSNMVKCV